MQQTDAAYVIHCNVGGSLPRLQLPHGPDGQQRFRDEIRDLMQLQDDEEFDVEFQVRVPGSSGRGVGSSLIS
jgi:hypothetical protein